MSYAKARQTAENGSKIKLNRQESAERLDRLKSVHLSCCLQERQALSSPVVEVQR